MKGAWGHWFLLCPRCDGRGASHGQIRCPECENWGWLDLGTTAPVAGGTVQRRMSDREVEDWKARIAGMEQQLFESRLHHAPS